ncbi:MAG: RluA family pseudouridine synthase [Proteobacteria bacterium]|nr:RluA family pseudouridine synthase [Pseudomonadota bacterium]
MVERPEHVDPEFIELTFVVAREFSGWRADRYIAHRVPRLSRTRVQRILKENAFDEAGLAVKPNRVLRAGERITVYKRPPEEPDTPRSFGVLVEDEWLLAVDKPPCLPVHPTARYFKNTLTALLEERYGKPHPMIAHRLDSETSGIVLCVKGIDAERAIKGMFADRKMSKTYLAVVTGALDPPAGRIEAPLSSDASSAIRVKMGCRDPDGLPSLTDYRTIEVRGERSLVELHPRTGRQHQIRAHLAHVGHPIVGDKMYGPDETLFLEYIETGPTDELVRRAGHRRHALHAAELAFVHPFTKEPIRIVSPLPEDIAGLL